MWGLWVDGCIYPPDPLTGRPPQFEGLTSFVKFACEGNEGLYGYTCRLATQGLAGVHQTLANMQTRLQGNMQMLMEKDRLLAEKDRENQKLQQAMTVIENAMHADPAALRSAKKPGLYLNPIFYSQRAHKLEEIFTLPSPYMRCGAKRSTPHPSSSAYRLAGQRSCSRSRCRAPRVD